MKHLKKFNEINEEDSIDYQLNNHPNNKITFEEAFERFIKGQKIISSISVDPFGDWTKPNNERFYGDGIVCENGYKYLSYGGGCSGEDCNITFIVSPEDKLVISKDW